MAWRKSNRKIARQLFNSIQPKGESAIYLKEGTDTYRLRAGSESAFPIGKITEGFVILAFAYAELLEGTHNDYR